MHVGGKRYVELHYLPEPVVPVLVEEMIGDPLAAEVTHYGWDDAGHPRDSPSMIQRRCSPKDSEPARAWMLLDMCFPYGIGAAIRRGEGKMVSLRITRRPDPTVPE